MTRKADRRRTHKRQRLWSERLSILLAGHLCAYVIAWPNYVAYAIALVLGTCVVGLAYYGVVALLVGPAKKRTAPMASLMASIAREVEMMSMADARREAFVLLDEGRLFDVQRAAEPMSRDPASRALPESIREFFERYHAVRESFGEMHLDRSEVAWYEESARLIRVGRDMGVELVMKEGEDALMEVEAEDPEAFGDFNHRHHSIYHFIVCSARLLEA